MIRWLLRLIVAFFIVAVVLVVAVVLLKDALIKEVMQNRIRRATGMDAQIGKVDVSVLTPMLTIDDLKLYNPPDFGGSLCLNMPELHVEYDPVAARTGKLRLSLMRLNISEIDVVQDKKGRVNFDAATQKSGAITNDAHNRSPFSGIETLNITLGTLRWTNIATHRARVYQLGIKDQVFRGIKSEADFAAVVALASSTNSNWNVSDFLSAFLGR